jgi:hypothetical protein
MSDVKISVFKNIFRKLPIGTSGIDYVLNAIKDGGTKNKVLLYRETNLKKHKHTIPCVTWSGLFEKRNVSNIITFSNFIYLDTDSKPTDTIKDDIAREEYIKAVWDSVSSRGLGILSQSFDLNRENFKPTFHNIKQKLENKFGIVIDPLSDYTRVNIISYDTDIIVNDDVIPVAPSKPITIEKKPIVFSNFSEYIETNQTPVYEKCMFAYTVAYKNAGEYSEGRKHNFTVRYARFANNLGVSEQDALSFICNKVLFTNHSIKTLKDIYERYSHEHGSHFYN